MDYRIPEFWVRRFEVFDQICDVAPDGVSGNVGVHCPGEVEPFVEALIEGVELVGVR